MEELDVKWDGYSHKDIVQMVNTGPGASLTAQMEEHLHWVSEVLNELGDQVSRVLAGTGEDWQGGAADGATDAMVVLRDVDDGMHFTSNTAGIRAFGQSDNAGWVRANMPPVVEVHPPEPTGRPFDVLNVSVDFQKQQAAAKQAEERAREIMRQYTEATRERAAGMAPLSPVPQVVFAVGEDPGKPVPGGEQPPARRGPAGGPGGGGPVAASGTYGGGPGTEPEPGGTAPDGSGRRGEPGGTTPTAAGSPAVAADPVSSPGASAAPVHAPGGSASPLAGRVVAGVPAEGSAARPRGGELPGRQAQRGPAGGGSAAAGRGASMARGGAGRVVGESPFAAAQAARREEEREHRTRYGLPSAAPFEPDAPELDPYREGWQVAPEVVGPRDEDG